MSGWIRLWRQIREHQFWQERRRFSKAEAWIDLLMDAAFEDHNAVLGSTVIRVKRGQALISQRKKAIRWGWSRQATLNFISVLRRLQMVGHEVGHGPEGGYTLLTINNYEKFQGSDETWVGHEVGHGLSHEKATRQATVRPRARHTEEEKKGEEEKYLAGDSAPAGSDAPRKRGNGKATDPNVRRVIDAYFEAFKAKHGTPPPINGGKCGKIAKAMLRGRPAEEAVWVVEEFFTSPPPFYRDKGLYGLEHVLAAMPTLLARKAEMERGVS